MRIPSHTPDPLRPDAGRATRGGAAERSGASGSASTPATPATPAAGDRIELSEEARRLSATFGSDAPPSGAVDAATVSRVGQRIASGYYDRPEVRDELVRRIAQSFVNGDGTATERS